MSKTQLRDVSAGAYCKVRTGRAILVFASLRVIHYTWRFSGRKLQCCSMAGAVFLSLAVPRASWTLTPCPWTVRCAGADHTRANDGAVVWEGRWLSRGHPAAQQTCVLDPDFWTLGSEL